jgi:hypothetical protein
VTDLALELFSTEKLPSTVNILLYGPAGAGKSTAAASAPGPVMFINLEGPNALHYARKTAREAETEVLEVRVDWGEDPRAYFRESFVAAKERGVNTIVIDTLGKLRDGIAFNIGGESPSLPQWGQVGKAMTTILRELRDSDMNTVLICHERVLDSDTGDRIVEPLVGGKTTTEAMAEVDVIAYCGAVRDENGTRYLAQLVESKGRRAKDRSGALGDVVELNLTDLIASYLASFIDDSLPFNEKETK